MRKYDFDPYGRELTVSGTWTASTRFRFAGGERDDASLYHFGQRYYSPTNGRWTQQDPISQAADVRRANRYTYVGGDPVNLTDPSGTRNLTASAGAYIGGASVMQDTTGPRARATRFGGYSFGAGSPNASAIAYTGNADSQSSLTGTFCCGYALALTPTRASDSV